MMRMLGLVCMLILVGVSSIGQPNLDSLLYEYQNQVGSKKIETTIKISSYYDNDNLFTALTYANEALGFATEFGTDKELLAAYNRLGIVYYKLGNLSKSNQSFLVALNLVSSIKDPNLSNESRLMNNIANNYGELKQVDLAVEYYKKSLELKKKMNDSTRYSITLNNLALTYSSMQYYDSAYQSLQEALVIDRMLGDEVSEAYSNGSLGEILLEDNKPDTAIYYLNQALTYFGGIPDNDYVLGYYHHQLGEADLLLNRLISANTHFTVALEFAIAVGARSIQRDAYKGLQTVAEKLGDYEKAFAYSQIYAALQDTLYKAESAQKLGAIETSYQIINKEQEISILNANAQVDKFKFYSAIALVLIVMVLLASLYYRYLFKTRANNILQQKNNTIEKQNKEIMDGVKYAKGIQEAILPDFKTISSYFKKAYLYYKPTQVVSGDFYWVEKINGDIILVLADGTGHGVPGAFLSVMGTSLLRQIITEKRICKPDEILKELNEKVTETLGQSKLNNSLKDGMDVAVCAYNKEKKQVAFAGAKRPLLLKKGNKVQLIKGNRSSIGGSGAKNPLFDTHYFDVEEGDSIILFTDGIIDQFGGADNKKFLIKRLEKIVEKGQGISHLVKEFEGDMLAWKGGGNQTDDMLLVAVEL